MKPIISENCRIRIPDQFTVGEYSIVDDFSYFSTQIEIGRFCHVAANCTISGGPDLLFKLGDYSGVSTGTRIFCATDDFIQDIVNILPAEFGSVKTPIQGDVIMERLTGIGANTVVMPGTYIPEGAVIGAQCFVPLNFEVKPWSVYAGNPLKLIMPRNKKKVLKQVEELEKRLDRIESPTA
ncbi:MAG: hypothetical protein OEU36_00840 [Gammaproteobacteria bacterium]|nr:hypothetical protein [Gammaproteobacteria bacterium]